MQLNRLWLTPRENIMKLPVCLGFDRACTGSQYSKARKRETEKWKGSEWKSAGENLLQTSTALSSTPDALQHEAPFHSLFWGPTCSFPCTAGLFGPEGQAKFPSPAISHGCASINRHHAQKLCMTATSRWVRASWTRKKQTKPTQNEDITAQGNRGTIGGWERSQVLRCTSWKGLVGSRRSWPQVRARRLLVWPTGTVQPGSVGENTRVCFPRLKP